MSDLLEVVNIAAVTENEIKSALAMGWKDFEDSVQYSVAFLGAMDGVVTRNGADYKDVDLMISTPEQILEKCGMQ